MFKPNTILARRDDPTKRLRVVGPSPVQLAAAAEWEGSGGQAVVVTDADHFAENTPAPIAWLNLRYEVVEEPLPPPPLTFDRPDPLSARRTPEEQFAAMARTSVSEAARLEEEAEQAKAQAAALAEGLLTPPLESDIHAEEFQANAAEITAKLEQIEQEKPKTGRSARPKNPTTGGKKA